MVRTLWSAAILTVALALAGLMVRGLRVNASTGGSHEWSFAPPQAEGMVSKGWSDRPTDGPITEWYDTGVRRFEGRLIRGEPDGPWRHWWENGHLRWRGTYTLGRLDGRTEGYHANGELQFVATYKNGVLNGPIENRNEDGRLLQTGAYLNGRKRGAFVFYDPDGNIDTHRSGIYDGDERIGDLPPERLATQNVSQTKR